MKQAKASVFLSMIAGLLFITSCQKEVAQAPDNTTTNPPPSQGAVDKVKDSSLLYARDIYLWYNQIPASFNAQSYSDPNKIMEAIRAYSIEPGFSAPVDRWSFAYKQQDWDNVSSGVTQDFGLNVFFRAADDLRVKYVESASPAGKAGIRRGWKITKINGNTSINTNNIDFVAQNIFSSSSTSFTFEKPDGTTKDITLNAATYQEHPVLLDTTYNVSGKQVGYLVFNSFLGDTTEIYNKFQTTFNKFSQQNVGDVVIDLRYNGGGYVSVQEKLANYIINSTGNGNVMMTQEYNDKYTRFNSTSRYNKLGSLNINRIFFIVSNNTASASELLINNLKPYMDVKLVGPSNTYGKPVGFFPIPVGDWYIFPVSFRTTNKNGEGSYFNGLTVNSKVADGLDKDWGDVNESCLASAIKYISSGNFRTSAIAPIDPAVESVNSKISANSFKGAIGKARL